jgi:hypothetical protein
MTLYEGDAGAVHEAVLVAARNALAAGRRVGVLATNEQRRKMPELPIVIAELGSGQEPSQVGARLYAALRELDAAGLDVILAFELPEKDGLWHALRDRLRRAATEVVQVS